MAIVTWFYYLFYIIILTALVQKVIILLDAVLGTLTLSFYMQLEKFTGMHKDFDTNEALKGF